MKKNDGIIIGAILVLAVIIYFTQQWQNRVDENNKLYVEIYVNNELYDRSPLNIDKEVVIETDGGINVVKIENQSVVMKESNCPNKICMKTGHIHKPGSTIVCLPHQVYVQIVGDDNEGEDLDAISE